MSLLNDDLFAVYRTSETKAYKLPASSLQTKLPDGDDDNKMLVWNGATWVPGDSIDGGEYAT